MCGQPTAYNTYATLSYTNPLFMGFSGYLNVNKEIIFGTQIYVQILVLQRFVELSDVVESGGIYSVRNAFATRLQQKYLKNIGHFSVIDTGECLFFMQILLQRLCCPFLLRFCCSHLQEPAYLSKYKLFLSES